MDGILLVDKPAGLTSHDVVDCVRAAAGMRRVGHTGTLDRAATGLLILCLGKATRLSEQLTRMDKTYEGYMRLGIETDSYDMDGNLIVERPVPALTTHDIERVCNEFTGEIQQVPPMVSAVKIGGERLYKIARKGGTVEREPRPVTVHEFSVLGYDPPLAKFRVACTSGTYVRALAHDVGSRLGCGAALDSLRRTRVGNHSVDGAAPLDLLQSPDDVRSRLVPMGEALDLPSAIVGTPGMTILATGGQLRAAHLDGECPVRRGWLQLKSRRGELLALAQVEPGPVEPRIAPRRVFLASRRG